MGLVPALPANVGRFLDTVDEVLNSNTVLVRVSWSTAPGPDELPEALAHALRSESFRSDVILQMVDQGYWDDGAITESCPLVLVTREPTVQPVSDVALVQRLLWMLTTEQCSWYRKQLPVPEALPLVQGFLVDLLGARSAAEGAAPSVEELAQSIPPGWDFSQVAPDFLYSTGYFGSGLPEAPEGGRGYFDGSPADGCLVLRRGPFAWLLLTNGSP
jgi:hypothetical protein